MRFFDPIDHSAAARFSAAVLLAVLFAVATGAPLSAHAGSVVTTGVALSSEESSAAPSVDASAPASIDATDGPDAFDWVLGSAAPTPSVDATVEHRPTGPHAVRRIIAQVGDAAGLSRSEISALLWIAYRESRFHPTSHSRSDCHGLFQLSAGMAHGRPWKNPTWNTKRAIRYMEGRYGGVLQAKAFWQHHHWY